MATIKDIARMAGVSATTVSRSLRNLGRISSVTRARIQQLAEQHDLILNANARSLSTKKTGTIGIVYPEFESHFHRSSYLDQLIHDLRAFLERKGLDCLIFGAEKPGGGSNISRLVRQRKIDGILLVLGEVAIQDWTFLLESGFPTVLVHAPPILKGQKADNPIFNVFFTDNFQGGLLATRHLFECGCLSPVCLADDPVVPEMLERTQGFVQAYLEHGLRPPSKNVVFCPSSFDHTYEFVLRHLDLFDEAGGVFAHTDIMAAALIKALSDSRIKVPEQVKIVGYDDIPLCRMLRPTLTTIHQPREIQAERATEKLLELIESGAGGVPVREVIAPRLVIRESTRRDHTM